MLRFEVCDRAILYSLVACLGAMSPLGQAHARPGFENLMSNNLQWIADDVLFVSKEDAEKFLADALRRATSANPKYRSGSGGVETRWLTKAIAFETDKNSNGTRASMSEDVLEYRNGVRSPVTSHETAFLLEDVEISERKDSPDVTESGEGALGVIFNCHSGKCMRSTYNGAPTLVEWTDIYIQDASSRSGILKAFEALKRMSGERGLREDASPREPSRPHAGGAIAPATRPRLESAAGLRLARRPAGKRRSPVGGGLFRLFVELDDHLFEPGRRNAQQASVWLTELEDQKDRARHRNCAAGKRGQSHGVDARQQPEPAEQQA